MTQDNTTVARAVAPERATGRTAALPAIAAILFGLFIVGGVGLANAAALHNAAHDARHALGFPCH